jgi:branched-subunit amino acid aminotransferase/4-amino-4-deoxychorismate lyase
MTAVAEPLLVADSFVVEAGMVRGWDAHWRRFARGCTLAGLDAAALVDFELRVAAALPEDGAWFPRIECVAAATGPDLRLRLRPAPERSASVRAWIDPEPDDRRKPRVKGPELDRLGQRRRAARSHGAGEAVLQSAEWDLLEGAYSSLLWWDGDTLCAVPDEAPILPGVTRALLLDLAAADGVPVRFERADATRLDGRETWLTSALHGIRAVTGWTGDLIRPGAAERAPEWRRRLDELRRPLAAQAGGAGAGSARVL